jgi:sarcosine oxidase subunit alpha
VWAVLTERGLLKVRARTAIVATGGYDQNALFADNDRPGVISARATGRLLLQHGVRPGSRIIVLAGAPGPTADHASALSTALQRAGVDVLTVAPPSRARRALGRCWVEALELDGGRREPCDLVAVAEVPAPASELARQRGANVIFDPGAGGFRAERQADGLAGPDLYACGDVCGYVGPSAASEDGARVGHCAAARYGVAGRQPTV